KGLSSSPIRPIPPWWLEIAKRRCLPTKFFRFYKQCENEHSSSNRAVRCRRAGNDPCFGQKPASSACAVPRRTIPCRSVFRDSAGKCRTLYLACPNAQSDTLFPYCRIEHAVHRRQVRQLLCSGCRERFHAMAHADRRRHFLDGRGIEWRG